jgi:hypothetical protein
MGDLTMRFPALPVNHSAFREIDTHEKAYALGFLLADGCVREPRQRSGYRVNLRIKAVDLLACRRLQELAGGNLRLIEGGYRAEWEVSSATIAADLTKLGVTPRKTFTASLQWDLIPSDLHGAVLAGLIDGDGHMRYSKEKRRAELTIVTASSTLKDQLLERFWFFKSVEVLSKNPRRRTLYRIQVENHRERLGAMIQTIYGALPFPILGRKQAVLDQLKGFLAGQDAYDDQMGHVAELKASGLTIKQIAAALGTSVRPIRARLEAADIDSRRLVFTDDDHQELRRLHERGMTVLQVHRELGKGTEQAVRYQLQRMGCITKRAPRGQKQKHPDAAAIVAEFRCSKPVHEIASDRRMSKGVICRVLREEGVQLNSGSAQKLFREQIVWADQELSKGHTLRSVAEALGVSGTLIRLRRKQLLAQTVGEIFSVRENELSEIPNNQKSVRGRG